MYMKSPKMGINSCNIVSVHMVISLKQFHFLSAKYWKSFIKRAWSPYETSTNKSSQVFWDNEFENKKNMLSLSRGFTTGYKVFNIEIDIYQIKSPTSLLQTILLALGAFCCSLYTKNKMQIFIEKITLCLLSHVTSNNFLRNTWNNV